MLHYYVLYTLQRPVVNYVENTAVYISWSLLSFFPIPLIATFWSGNMLRSPSVWSLALFCQATGPGIAAFVIMPCTQNKW